MFAYLVSPPRALFLMLLLLSLVILTPALRAAPQVITTVHISVDSSGTQGNGSSFSNPALSSDGRYVAFHSSATNLVGSDTNGVDDVFLRDTQTGTTTRVSVDSAGAQADGSSRVFSISSDGRYVAFDSTATNLVSGDTNGTYDSFIHDTQNNTTTRVSIDSAGTQGNGASTLPVLSSDGRYVAFDSSATNLVANDTNGVSDIFVRDTLLNTTTRVSVDSSGTESSGGHSFTPSISGDGRYIAFRANATNLVPNDTNGAADIFVRDTLLNTTTRVSVDSLGAQSNSADSYNPVISSDGRHVAFESNATNLVSGDTNGFSDIFVHDTQTGSTTRVSVDSTGTQGNGSSHSATISSAGRYVAFYSSATNFDSGDSNTDIFLRDTQTSITSRVSVNTTGGDPIGGSYEPTLSSNGAYIAFTSLAFDLTASGDTNGLPDIFLATGSPLTVRLSTFSAVAAEKAIRVQWETEAELNNLGFHLYRSQEQQAPGTRLNGQLIPSIAPGSSQGGQYEWLDSTAQPGVTYFYWLEDVDASGVTTRHGPITAQLEAPTAVTLGTLHAPSRAVPAGPLALLFLTGAALLWRSRKRG